MFPFYEGEKPKESMYLRADDLTAADMYAAGDRAMDFAGMWSSTSYAYNYTFSQPDFLIYKILCSEHEF